MPEDKGLLAWFRDFKDLWAEGDKASQELAEEAKRTQAIKADMNDTAVKLKRTRSAVQAKVQAIKASKEEEEDVKRPSV